METIMNFLQQTGFSMIPENWKMLVMIAISLVLAYLAIVKKFGAAAAAAHLLRHAADQPARRGDVP